MNTHEQAGTGAIGGVTQTMLESEPKMDEGSVPTRLLFASERPLQYNTIPIVRNYYGNYCGTVWLS